MNRFQIVVGISVVAGLSLLAGCSASSAGFTALRVGQNLSEKDSHLIVYIDGHEAKQSTIAKAAKGYAQFKVKAGVSTQPTFRFEFDDPSHFGRIRMTNINVYQEYEADYSGSPEFTVTPAQQEADFQFKPGVTYQLGAPGSKFKVYDFYTKPVGGVSLEPGREYMFLFTVAGDRSETIQVFFDTK